MTDLPVDNNKRGWSLKWHVLLGAMLLFSLLLAFALVMDKAGERKLNVVMSEARSDGGPVTLVELEAARKAWPDNENGANVILKIKNRLEELRKNEQSLAALPGFEFKNEPPLGHYLFPEQDQAAGDILARLAPELAQIDRLAQYQGGRFPLTIDANPMMTLFPHLPCLRISARLKAAQTCYRAMHGDTSRLVDDIRVILLHGQLLADEPLLVSVLTDMSLESLAVDTAQRVCALTTLTPEQLTQLQNHLARLVNRERLYLGIRGERASFIAIADWYRMRGKTVNFSLYPSDPELPLAGSGRVPGLRGMLMRDEAIGVQLFNRLVAVAGDRKKAMQTAKQIADECHDAPRHCTLTVRLMPSFARIFELDGHLEAQIRSAAAALAAERYRLDHGQFPEKLELLVPAYLERVPLDPFNDQPLRMRNSDGMLMIYSVGEDLADDEGSLVGRWKKSPCKDWGFILLSPELRGLPATQPATEPSAESETAKAERIKRFREGAPRGKMTNDEIRMKNQSRTTPRGYGS